MLRGDFPGGHRLPASCFVSGAASAAFLTASSAEVNERAARRVRPAVAAYSGSVPGLRVEGPADRTGVRVLPFYGQHGSQTQEKDSS